MDYLSYFNFEVSLTSANLLYVVSAVILLIVFSFQLGQSFGQKGEREKAIQAGVAQYRTVGNSSKTEFVFTKE